MEDNKELFDERNRSSDPDNLGELNSALLAAGTAILIVETDQDAKVETIAISCTVDTWFSAVVRKHDGSDPKTVLGPFRHNADGLLYIEENFKDPIFSYGANKEVAIVILKEKAAGVEVAASMKIWERRA